jgi:hypothetical protein
MARAVPTARLAPAKKYNPWEFCSDVSKEDDETQNSTPVLLTLVAETNGT